jgi:hypothetical protein
MEEAEKVSSLAVSWITKGKRPFWKSKSNKKLLLLTFASSYLSYLFLFSNALCRKFPSRFRFICLLMIRKGKTD